MPQPAQETPAPAAAWWRRGLRLLWRLIVTTVGACMRYRVTGLAAEAAFFAVLSVPPLIFALTGAIGLVSEQFSAAQIDDVRQAVLELSSRALTEGAVSKIIEPTLNEVTSNPRYDVISIGFILSLWSGSRALNVFVDTITIMHGLGGKRGIVKTRALSFSLYVLGMLTSAFSIPLIVAGPKLVEQWLPGRLEFLIQFYWPLVIVSSICFLATLYHVSVPVRTNWSFNLPGATFSLVVWVLGSAVLRWVLTVTAAESTSIYGPLAAPIAVLLWLYILSIAVLIGAALNAAFDTVFPQKATLRARREQVERLRQAAAEKDARRLEEVEATARARELESALPPDATQPLRALEPGWGSRLPAPRQTTNEGASDVLNDVPDDLATNAVRTAPSTSPAPAAPRGRPGRLDSSRAGNNQRPS